MLLGRAALAFLSALTLAFSGVVSAVAEDEQWPIPNEVERGHHSVLIEETIKGTHKLPILRGFDPQIPEQLSCKSLDDPNCSSAIRFEYTSHFAACASADQLDCISELSFTGASVSAAAKFVRYVYPNHPNAFSGDNKLLASAPGAPSLWRVPEAPHAAGDLYLVIAGRIGAIANARVVEDELFAYVVPVSEKASTWNGLPDENGIGAIIECVIGQNSSGKNIITGCGGNASDFGQFRCSMFEQDGTCLLQRAHNPDLRVTLGLNLLAEPVGWLHGRIVEPEVSITPLAQGKNLKVTAGSVRVPTLYHGELYSKMPADLQKYWDDCLRERSCDSWTRIANSNPGGEPDGNLRNVQSYELPYGQRILKLVSTFASAVNDTAIAAPSSWTFRSLKSSGSGTLAYCVGQAGGLGGLVTTNATAYSEGPPALESGMLQYKVAGLHYLPDGKTEHLGTYDLIMRSDVARCVYGFSNAPIAATVQVVGGAGEEKVATTIVRERNGWLTLAAYGFTFSEKEIRVKLTQEQPSKATAPNVKPKTFTTPALASKLTAAQKAQIRKFALASGKKSFTCTGFYRLAKDKAAALSRAQLACAEAKAANKNFKTQSKTAVTKSATQDRRVLIVSK